MNERHGANATSPQVSSLERIPASARAQESQTSALDHMLKMEQHKHWETLSRLPRKLGVAVPVPAFKVRDLIRLHTGQMVRSAWPSSGDLPIRIGAVQLAWGEFEVIDRRMAVRITRLA